MREMAWSTRIAYLVSFLFVMWVLFFVDVKG